MSGKMTYNDSEKENSGTLLSVPLSVIFSFLVLVTA